MVANLFGNVCYLCFPSPATIYLLPECIERLFVWRAQIHAVGIAQAFKMRRNSVILLHGFEAALNDNWSVPICPFFSSPSFRLGRSWSWSHSIIRHMYAKKESWVDASGCTSKHAARVMHASQTYMGNPKWLHLNHLCYVSLSLFVLFIFFEIYYIVKSASLNYKTPDWNHAFDSSLLS